MHRKRMGIPRAYLKAESELGRRHKAENKLVIYCAFLLAVGLTILYAIGPALSILNNVSPTFYTYKQLIAIIISIIIFIIFSYVPISFWKTHYKNLIGLALFATLLAIIMPVNPQYPAHRWVRLGGLSFQSVEFLKFMIIIWFANYLAKTIKNNEIKNNKTVKVIISVLFALGALVAFIQSDLGSMAVIIVILISMAFVAGISLQWLARIGLLMVAGVIAMILIFPYRMARLETFFHPQANCQSSGYQVCQALIAVGSGGISGLGLGKSVQAYGYEPEAGNDSIFAIYAETFGFIGCLVLIGVFLALLSKLKDIALRTPDDFSRLVIVGIIAWLATQSIINIGAMVGLLPLKGITLPFISYGGTSVVFVAAIMGVAFQISRYTSYQKIGTGKENIRSQNNEDFSSRRRIGGSYNSSSRSSFRD